MKIIAACSLLLATALVGRAQDNFADTVVSYTPGSTFDSTYQNPNVALGAPTSSATINAPAFATSQIAVINPGGELTLGFNTPIMNDPTDHAGGMDFTIFGNDFFINGSGGKFSGASDHPGLTVWVSQNDVNFYQLQVPNGYGADDSFPTQGSGNPLVPVNPSLTLSSFVGLTDAQALSLYNGSAGGASFSISWAVDANGNPVDLSSINEIEIIPTSGYGLVDAVARVEDVPEPTTWALFILGGISLAFLQRRRNAEKIASRTKKLSRRPRVFCMEWADPVYCAGHWVPEMIELAGGFDALARKGTDSTRMAWNEVLKWAPEILILSPCGFPTEKALAQMPFLESLPGWTDIPAVPAGRVYAADANSYFARPGPRVVRRRGTPGPSVSSRNIRLVRTG